MPKSGIIKSHPSWDKVIDLKLQHIQMKTDFGKQIFIAIFGFFVAVIIGLITTASYTIPKIGVLWFIGIIIGLFILFYFLIGKMAIHTSENIDEDYNRLFYEILSGTIYDIRPLSNEEYDKLIRRGF